MTTPGPGYCRAASLDEALVLLERLGDRATVLAGGQEVVPLMNQGRAAPAALVDVSRLAALARVDARDGWIAIGSLVTHRTVERSRVLGAACPLLPVAAAAIGGGVQVRNRGTIGGSVCSANPAYDYGAPLAALGAGFTAVSRQGERRIAVAEFFRDAGATALRPDELLVAITVPALPPSAGTAYEKLKFTDGCYTIAGAACVVELSGAVYASVRIAVGGVAPVPVRLDDVEAWLVGRRPSESLGQEVALLTQRRITDPIGDALADGEYRRAMAAVMACRALARATDRARRRGVQEGAP